MEVTERKAIANRTNALKGGVKTAEGKAISSRNAIKHGILAKGETAFDAVELKDIFKSLVDEFRPQTFSDQLLVEQLALTTIRMHRCARLEAEILREPHIQKQLFRIHNIYCEYESRLLSRFLRLRAELTVKTKSTVLGSFIQVKEIQAAQLQIDEPEKT